MKLNTVVKASKAIKIQIKNGNKEVGRAFLYLIRNQLHKQPYGLMEDVFVDESLRGQGFGSKLILEVIKQAKKHNCYKLLATSRNSKKDLHKFYKKFGFKIHGVELRINF